MKGAWLVMLFVALVVVLIALQSRPTRIIINDSPIKFSSVRKHPFDVYSDPYHPPARENPYMFGRDTSYQQVGVLSGGHSGNMLPLFGRPSPYSSSKWEYYTMSNNGLKLPVTYKHKPCDSDTGCDELIGGNKDHLSVLGLGKFSAHVYGVKEPAYNPAIF